VDKLNLNITNVGCYVDGHWGKYATARMVRVAETFGFKPTEEEERHLAADERGDMLTDYTFEYVIDAADRAEAWLNEHTPADLVWHWQEGEFFLSRVDEDADED
jgi:hypothetical protein